MTALKKRGHHPKLNTTVEHFEYKNRIFEIKLHFHYDEFQFCCGEFGCYTWFLHRDNLIGLALELRVEWGVPEISKLKIQCLSTHAPYYRFEQHGTHDTQNVVSYEVKIGN